MALLNHPGSNLKRWLTHTGDIRANLCLCLANLNENSSGGALLRHRSMQMKMFAHGLGNH